MTVMSPLSAPYSVHTTQLVKSEMNGSTLRLPTDLRCLISFAVFMLPA